MEELIPSAFYLSQNSPNPFKHSTNIKYCLPIKTNVYLTVYNSVGDMIKVLVNKTQNAGTYEIKFNGKDYANGEYYLQLQTGYPAKISGQTFNKIKKIVLTR